MKEKISIYYWTLFNLKEATEQAVLGSAKILSMFLKKTYFSHD